MRKAIEDEILIQTRDTLQLHTGKTPSSREISETIKKSLGLDVDPDTVRGRFIAMGQPLSGNTKTTKTAKTKTNYFKSGDKVKIKDLSNVLNTDGPGLNKLMRDMSGQELTLDYNDNSGWWRVKDNGFSWSEEWLEDIAPQAPAPPPTPPSFIKQLPVRKFAVPAELEPYIPKADEFDWYLERDVDTRLAHHYMLGKYPLTQGKQGTGKTASHAYFAFKQQLPFFLFSCYEDFKLAKLFGDKTIVNGTIVFQESLFTKAIQGPSVIVFDEVNALSQANTYDFHALLQNRQLFIKDADNGNGKVYRVHPDCFIGFAQNPKSAKYIGGQIRSSNFLGRCTYITYPEFSNTQLKKAINKKHDKLPKDVVEKFVKFYQGCVKAIDESQLPIDVSIRQLNNVIDLYVHGMDLRMACEDGLASMAEAASQPKAKEALMLIAEAVWAELMVK